MQTPTSNLTNFNQGIIKVSHAQDFKNLKLPQLTQFRPSEAKVEARTPQLFKAISLESVLHKSFLPRTSDLENLSPGIYAKRLKEAKEEFKKLIEEAKRDEGRKKRDGQGFDDEEDDEEIFEQVIEDLTEMEANQDLLWMLRQVVHLA